MRSLPIAKALQSYMLEHGVTQEELARRAGVSQSVLSRIVAGHVVSPQLQTLGKLARAVGREAQEFVLSRDEAPPNDVSASTGQHGVSPVCEAMIRVLLVHDQILMREGLRAILGGTGTIEVVSQAADADEALAAAHEHDPDVIVMDLATPGLDNLDAIKRPHAPHAAIPLIILTAQPESVDAGRLLRTGALGYVAAQAGPAELIEAVRTVHDGRHYVCRHLKHALEQARPAEDDAQAHLARLTKRERLVLGLLAAGQSTRQIAAGLGLSRKTVSAHRMNILAKLGLRNNVELARFAIEHELLGH